MKTSTESIVNDALYHFCLDNIFAAKYWYRFIRSTCLFVLNKREIISKKWKRLKWTHNRMGKIFNHFTAWKVSKYGVISGPYCPAFEYRKIRTRKNSVFGYFSRIASLYEIYQVRAYLTVRHSIHCG